jgi:eukaryotic-like serine/threonine-protein kinase
VEVFFAGQRLAERYVLVELIGSGGMSHVWHALDEVLGRPVALKTLDAALHAEPALCTAIRREARAAASIAHPNVTQVFDFGEERLPDGGAAPYLVMELLVGQNLAARLRSGPLPWQEAVAVCAGVASALSAAHRLGVVHRDIKPANVVLTDSGAKVVDFGIAAVTAGPDGDGEAPRAGTPAYVAPEVLTGGTGTSGSDVYALGALLYTALTGTAPFAVTTWAEATLAHVRGALPAPIMLPDLPHEIRELCARCLSATPWTRPTSEEAAEVLARWSAPVSPAAGFSGLFGPSGAASYGIPTQFSASPTLPEADRRTGVMALPAAVSGASWPVLAHVEASHTQLMIATPEADRPAGAVRAGRAVRRARRRRRSVFALLSTCLTLVGIVVISIAAGLLTSKGLRVDVFSRAHELATAAPAQPAPAASPTPLDPTTSNANVPNLNAPDPTTPDAAMTAIESQVTTARNAGRIDAQVARDIGADIKTMRGRFNAGRSSDVQRLAQIFQRKVDSQVAQGYVDTGVGAELTRLLDILVQLSDATANGPGN